jgi:hypothetical protein
MHLLPICWKLVCIISHSGVHVDVVLKPKSVMCSSIMLHYCAMHKSNPLPLQATERISWRLELLERECGAFAAHACCVD